LFVEDGSYTAIITVGHCTAPAGTATTKFNVSDPAVKTTGGPAFSVAEGAAIGSAVLATFTDPGGAEPLSDYTASVAWGDGQTSAGTISVSGGAFTVVGGHTYAEEGKYTATVTVGHDSAPSATATTTFNV